jgi:hypothetical protein
LYTGGEKQMTKEELEIVKNISEELFGTKDYESVLKVISPSSEMMRIFKKRIEDALDER